MLTYADVCLCRYVALYRRKLLFASPLSSSSSKPLSSPPPSKAADGAVGGGGGGGQRDPPPQSTPETLCSPTVAHTAPMLLAEEFAASGALSDEEVPPYVC